jgi:hypothetical protein
MANLVLRTIYIDPELDDELRKEAFDSRISKNDLYRRYLRLGIDASQATSGPRKRLKVAASAKAKPSQSVISQPPTPLPKAKPLKTTAKSSPKLK